MKKGESRKNKGYSSKSKEISNEFKVKDLGNLTKDIEGYLTHSTSIKGGEGNIYGDSDSKKGTFSNSPYQEFSNSEKNIKDFMLSESLGGNHKERNISVDGDKTDYAGWLFTQNGYKETSNLRDKMSYAIKDNNFKVAKQLKLQIEDINKMKEIQEKAIKEENYETASMIKKKLQEYI